MQWLKNIWNGLVLMWKQWNLQEGWDVSSISKDPITKITHSNGSQFEVGKKTSDGVTITSIDAVYSLELTVAGYYINKEDGTYLYVPSNHYVATVKAGSGHGDAD